MRTGWGAFVKWFGRARAEERALLGRIAAALETRSNGGADHSEALVKAHNALVVHVQGLEARLVALEAAHRKLRGKVYKEPDFHTPAASRGAVGDALPAPLGSVVSGLPDIDAVEVA